MHCSRGMEGATSLCEFILSWMAHTEDGRRQLHLPPYWFITVIKWLESHLTWCLGVKLTGWLKLITVKKRKRQQEAEAQDNEHHWRERLSFSPGRPSLISDFYYSKNTAQKYTQKKKKDGFQTVCTSSYSFSTLISKLPLILLVVVYINVLSMELWTLCQQVKSHQISTRAPFRLKIIK